MSRGYSHINLPLALPDRRSAAWREGYEAARAQAARICWAAGADERHSTHAMGPACAEEARRLGAAISGMADKREPPQPVNVRVCIVCPDPSALRGAKADVARQIREAVGDGRAAAAPGAAVCGESSWILARTVGPPGGSDLRGCPMTAPNRILGLDVTAAEWTLVALELADPAAVLPVARVTVPVASEVSVTLTLLAAAIERLRPLVEGGADA
ncbi:hypothetical protein NON00_13135 [Roseomonas sp. GC11]|uniref:hypothetical protein n=1 Tax=Roseomonas sp. GC11 TaxID=2950546 RepID=UPI00210B0BF1|nr:hypothetical protein [Roseomonas sp. GC11]MCQ4160872.1 hypothetical protein [Roseomonas sp. GC11]